MIQINQGGIVRELPIIFPDFIVHADMADAVVRLLRREHKIPDARPVSAGFTSSLYVAEPGSMHGVSESLNLYARPGDGAHTAGMDYSHGIVFE